MKIKVQVTQNYYKSTEVEVDIPAHIQEDDVHDYLYRLNDKTHELQDELSNASLNLADNLEIEDFEIIED
jgi:hypothetical protein